MNLTVKLKRGQTVTRSQVQDLLTKAKSLYRYARYDMHNGAYLSIAFHQDNSIDIMTNCRDMLLWNNIKQLRNVHTMYRLVDFMLVWVNRLNRTGGIVV